MNLNREWKNSYKFDASAIRMNHSFQSQNSTEKFGRQEKNVQKSISDMQLQVNLPKSGESVQEYNTV